MNGVPTVTRIACLLALAYTLLISAADGPPVIIVQSPPVIVQQPPTILVPMQMPARIVKTTTYQTIPGEVVYVAAVPKKMGLLARIKAKLCCGN